MTKLWNYEESICEQQLEQIILSIQLHRQSPLQAGV